jgi:predicted metalloprotease with PDZ domain
MTPRSLFLLAILLCATAVSADERKMCSASAHDCEQAIRQLSSGRRYLGAQVQEINPGIIIKAVNPDGPASRAGLDPGDRLMAVNGRSTLDAGIKDFKQILADARETGRLSMLVLRRGILKRVEVRLEPYTKTQIDRMVAQHLAQSHAVATTAPSSPQQ